MKRKTKIICALLTGILIISLTGCAELSNLVNRIQGQLIGNSFNINIYDNQGGKVMDLSGSKVNMENVTDAAGEQSSYVDITIDGKQLLSVGSSIIFAEKGLTPVEDFTLSDYAGNNNSSTGFMPADRFINDIRNSIGTAKAVVIQSQLGVPLAVYQGNKVNMSVPTDLPKTTLISIDGKALYIHRANCIIVDSTLIH